MHQEKGSRVALGFGVIALPGFTGSQSISALSSMMSYECCAVHSLQSLSRCLVEPVNRPCNSNLPVGLTLFQEYACESKCRPNAATLINSALGTVDVFQGDINPPDLAEMIEREADSTFSKLVKISLNDVGF